MDQILAQLAQGNQNIEMALQALIKQQMESGMTMEVALQTLIQQAQEQNLEPVLQALIKLQMDAQAKKEVADAAVAQALGEIAKMLQPFSKSSQIVLEGLKPVYGEDYLTPDEVAGIKKEISPVRGKDYFTEADIASMISSATPVLGEDYFTEDDIARFKEEITPVKGKDYFDGEAGYTPVKGVDYFDGEKGDQGDALTFDDLTPAQKAELKGERGSPDTPAEIVKKLQSFKRKGWLDPEAIKGFSAFQKKVEDQIKRYGYESGNWGGSSSTFIALQDTPDTYSGFEGQYLRVKANGTGLEFASVSGGAGTWGSITGTLSDQLDLQAALDAKQPLDTQLTSIAGLSYSGNALKVVRVNAGENGFELAAAGGGTIDGTGTTNELTYWVDADTIGALSVATYPSLTEISYIKGLTSAVQTQLDGKQASDAQLTSLAGLSYASNALKVIRVNAGENAFELATISGGGLSDADYGDITVSGTGTVMTIDNSAVSYAKIQNVSATDKILGRITAGAGVIEEITFTDFAQSLADDVDAAAARTTLGLVIGTNVQAWDAQLDTWATITPSANGSSLVSAADYAAMRALLDLEAGTDFLSPAAIAAAYQPLDADLTDLASKWTTASASSAASLQFHEDTDNGAHKITLTAPASIASDKTITMPDATGTMALTSDIPSLTGYVNTTGTPANNQLAIFTDADTVEGDASLTWDGTSFNIATAKNFQIAGTTILTDAAGTTTLSGIDAIDATTEATIEAAIDTLANLTSVQGRTITLADAGANAFFGWDDTAGAYENLTQAEARTILGLGSAALVATDLADLNEATIEAAIDTLANLTSVQGRTILLADAGADALWGWDDSANQYANLSAADARTALGLATTDSPQFTALNIGAATDTTIARVSAGVISVEGKTIVNLTDGGTFLADISVPDEVYGAGWNGSVEVPTKNAVWDKIESLGSGSAEATTKAINQTTHGLAVGDVVKYSGSAYAKAQADSSANSEVVGIVSVVADANNFTLLTEGYISTLSGLTANTSYFLSASSAGALTSTEPSTAGQVSKPLLRAVSTTAGYFFNWRGLVIPSAGSAVDTGIVMAWSTGSAPSGYLLCDGSAVSRATYSALFAVISTTYGAGDGSTTFNLPDMRGRVIISSGTGTTVATFDGASDVDPATNQITVASNDWLHTGQAVALTGSSLPTGLSASTYYVIRISATVISLATTLAEAQNGTAIDITADGSGTCTLTQTLTARTLAGKGGEEAHAMSSTELLAHTHTPDGGGSFHKHGGSNHGGTSSNSAQDISLTGSTGGNAAMNTMQPYIVMNYIIKT